MERDIDLIPKAVRIVLAFLVSFGGTFVLLYFFSNSIAQQLNSTTFLGYQFIFPNPQGSAYYSSLYSVPVGFIGIVPILLIADGAGED